MKPGYKTSEFWLSLAALLLGALFASGLLGPDDLLMKIAGLAASVLGALGYAVPRAAVKKAEQVLTAASALESKELPPQA